MILNKKRIKCFEVFEAQHSEEKDKVYYFLYMARSHHKAKKLSLSKIQKQLSQWLYFL
jgi:hypothetical protein